jgi:hypothetical protein
VQGIELFLGLKELELKKMQLVLDIRRSLDDNGFIEEEISLRSVETLKVTIWVLLRHASVDGSNPA